MSKSKLKSAEQLFDAYAKNLTWYHPDLVDVFLCPLCLQPFPKDAIYSHDLTLEHIIPSSLGGKYLTLTCSTCNNQSGTQLEAHLVNRLRTNDAMAGKSRKPLRIKVQIGSGEFGADLYYSPEQHPNIKIFGIPEISNPVSHKRALEELYGHPQGFSISGSLGYKDIPCRVTALRIAYLLAFSYFGYGYILYENLNQVREQIFQPERETDALKSIALLDSAPKTNVFALLKEPQELRCFYAILELVTEQRYMWGIPLPGPDLNSSTIYQRWSAVSADPEVNFKPLFDIIDFASNYVSDPGYRFLPARLWQGQVSVLKAQDQ